MAIVITRTAEIPDFYPSDLVIQAVTPEERVIHLNMTYILCSPM